MTLDSTAVVSSWIVVIWLSELNKFKNDDEYLISWKNDKKNEVRRELEHCSRQFKSCSTGKEFS